MYQIRHTSTPANTHIRVTDLSFSYPNRRVLTNISFIVSSRERAGLIGENGSGKSTLLRLLAGIEEGTAGDIEITGHATQTEVGLLHQEPPFNPDHTLGEALESAVAPARKAATAVSTLAEELAADTTSTALADAYNTALTTAENLDAWQLETTIATTVAGLGLSHLPNSRPVTQLSGGQRARLALAWLLLRRPSVLLLDEPTNHLDEAAIAFLAGTLRKWQGPVLFSSHDRVFLDEVATTLLDLDPAPRSHESSPTGNDMATATGIGVSRFSGTYTTYLAFRADARARWEQQYAQEQAQLAKLRASVKDQQQVGHSDWQPRTESRIAKKFYADRNSKVVARRVNDVRSRLAELEATQLRKPPAELEFTGLPAISQSFGNPSGPVLNASQVSVSGRLKPVSLTLSQGEKLLITGPNGVGKSTLLKILAGQLAPETGAVNRASRVRVGMMGQEVDLPDPIGRGSGRSVAQTYLDLLGERAAQQTPLSKFGLLAPADFSRPVTELSMGQQRRLALAVLLANPPQVLVLDEPSNHFSLRLVTALEEAVLSFSGAVIIASHDRWLRANWAGAHLELR